MTVPYFVFCDGLLKGVIWPDVPAGYTPKTGVFWAFKEGFDVNVSPKGMTSREHFGDLAYHHGMAVKGLTATQMRQEIVNWIMRSYITAVQLKEEGKDYLAGLTLGKAMHTLADSFSPSHVARDSTGAITMFQDYNAQDDKKHALADKAITLRDRAARAQAQAACTQLAKYFNEYGRAKEHPSAAEVRQWLENGPFRLAENAQNGGTLERFAAPSPLERRKASYAPEPHPDFWKVAP